jgi:hypothetical protein
MAGVPVMKRPMTAVTRASARALAREKMRILLLLECGLGKSDGPF